MTPAARSQAAFAECLERGVERGVNQGAEFSRPRCVLCRSLREVVNFSSSAPTMHCSSVRERGPWAA